MKQNLYTKWSKGEVETAMRLYADGMRLDLIAEHVGYGRTARSVSMKLYSLYNRGEGTTAFRNTYRANSRAKTTHIREKRKPRTFGARIVAFFHKSKN